MPRARSAPPVTDVGATAAAEAVVERSGGSCTADATRRVHGRHGAWYMLAVITAVNAVNWADRQVVPILFPGIRGELALTDTQLGIIGGLAFSMIYAISSFAFGRAADRDIRRNVIAFGLVLWSIATAAGGLARGFGSLFAARFFTGLGEASLYPSAMSLIADRFPARLRGRAMGLFGAASAVGSGIGIGLGGALSETLGWRSVFFIYGAAGIVLLPLVLSVPESRRPAEGDHREPAVAVVLRLLRDRRLLVLWSAGLVMIASGLGYAAWIPSYFVRAHGMAVTSAGYLFGGAALVGGMAGSVLGGLWADCRRRARTAGELDVSAVAALLCAPLVAFTLIATWPPLFMAAGLLAPLAIFAYFPSLQTVMVDLVPARQLGLAYAINILFLGGIGSALGPFAVGYVSDASGSLGAGLAVTIAGMVLASLLALLAGRTIRRVADGDHAGS